MRKMEKVLDTLDDLATEAAAFVHSLAPNIGGATLVTLSGELGAGKTTFVQAVAKAFGVVESVTSPTFVLEKRYDLTNQAFKRLIHIDAYRLKGGEELTPLHFDETLKQAENLIMLEWPEMVKDALPVATHAVTLAVLPDGARTITYA
jgi:tRNA threonylcarbamoyladenosine biosynthesis protein TsaE